MAAKKPLEARARPHLVRPATASPEIGVLYSQLAGLSQQVRDRSSLVVDLVVGDNRIVHGLGRTPSGATVTPTVLNASFAWALTSRDEREAVIAVAGVAQPGAAVEFFATGGVAAARSGGGGLTPSEGA